MVYTVRVKIAKGVVLEEYTFDDLADAIEEADYAGYAGSGPVEITVVDGDGVQQHRRVHNA